MLDAIVYSLLRDGIGVTVFDSLARPGSECNLAWLQSQHPSDLLPFRTGRRA